MNWKVWCVLGILGPATAWATYTGAISWDSEGVIGGEVGFDFCDLPLFSRFCEDEVDPDRRCDDLLSEYENVRVAIEHSKRYVDEHCSGDGGDGLGQVSTAPIGGLDEATMSPECARHHRNLASLYDRLQQLLMDLQKYQCLIRGKGW